MSNTIIRFEQVYKEYRLGAIGGTTLRDELQRFGAKLRSKEDPTARILPNVATHNERFMALSDINFQVEKGDTLGIIGQNGAGKSTMLKLLSRVTAPTKGVISYNGRIASMLEVGTGFHQELTGRENVYMNGAILGMTKAEIDKKFDEIVAFAEMEKFIDTPVKRYSSGMYVKLAFAVAAHLDSEIMVMDEVLAVGDMKFQQKCLGKMGDAAANDGRTVLYVSHNMNTIRQLCNRCIVLDRGKMLYDGDVETAIGIYSDCHKQMQYHYDYAHAKRLPSKSRRMEYLTLDVLNAEEENICAGDPVLLRIITRANGDFDDMKIRLEIVAADNNIAGAMFSSTSVSAKQGEVFDLLLTVDTTHMAPGSYRFDLFAYESNEFGLQEWCDRVQNAMQLDLHKRNASDLEWISRNWGHTRYHDIEINAIERHAL